MTVSTLTNSVTYIGNGSATTFAVPFKVLDENHLVVKRRVVATNEIDHTYVGTDYSYSGIGDDSGTLTLSGTALSSSYQLEIERIVPYTQELDIVNAGGFYPETVEEQLDLMVMQTQQISTQADDIENRALMVPVGSTAPSYEDFADAFQGNPGGNVESVGLFTALALGLTEIPVGTDRVRTSGYSVAGLGSADYGYDATIDASYVLLNPKTSFLSSNGRGFKLISDHLTPWMFGAVGPVVQDLLHGHDATADDLVDNAEPIADLLEYVAAQDRKVTCDLRGNWGITDHDNDDIGVVIDQPRYRKQQFIGGNFVALEAMTTGFRLTLRGGRISGCLSFNGLPRSMETLSAYADRVVENGFEFTDSYRADIDELRVAHLKNQAVTDLASGNNILLHIGYLFFESCGSYMAHGPTTVSATFSGRTDTGGDGAYNQLSELTGMSSTAEFRADSLVYCTTTSTVHYVRSKTETAIKLYPWLPHGTTSGTLKSMHGGGAKFFNNDSTCVEFGRVDGFHGGVVLWSGGLYGIKACNAQGQFNSVYLALSKNVEGTTSTNLGTVIDRPHSEGNEFDLVQVTPGSTWEIGEIAVWGRDGENLFQRTVALKRRFASGTLGGISVYGDPLQGVIKRRGRPYYSTTLLTDNRTEAAETFMNRADGRPVFRTTGSTPTTYTINLEWDPYVASLFANSGSFEIFVVGTGTNRAPAGDIVVQPTAAQLADGYTVNGGATVTLTAPLSGRAHIVAILQPGTKNWLVSW